ncbi:hypothetical protein BC830DRAFT_1090369 [Chytriomyces sp. MP71]|nr:hypothetical protein BC830DRAFT_1090369 [Chytriomyces sp. MP71]
MYQHTIQCVFLFFLPLFIHLTLFPVVVVAQIPFPSPRVSNYNTLLWAIKGSYPSILLIDVLVTRESNRNSTSGLGRRTRDWLQGPTSNELGQYMPSNTKVGSEATDKLIDMKR